MKRFYSIDHLVKGACDDYLKTIGLKESRKHFGVKTRKEVIAKLSPSIKAGVEETPKYFIIKRFGFFEK